MTHLNAKFATIRRTTVALGIALAALTLATMAQADTRDRGVRGGDRAMHHERDTQTHRYGSRTDRGGPREIHRDRRLAGPIHHAGPRPHGGFILGRVLGGQPHYQGRPVYRHHANPATFRGHHGGGCRIVRHVRFDHHGRKIITKRRVCYGRHGR